MMKVHFYINTYVIAVVHFMYAPLGNRNQFRLMWIVNLHSLSGLCNFNSVFLIFSLK